MITMMFRAARTQLDDLVDRAAAGEEFIITKGRKPVARLAPLAHQPCSVYPPNGQSASEDPDLTPQEEIATTVRRTEGDA